ncbi:nucleotide sugar dehydrogenase [Pedobacter sp. MC2016-14]|uniref:nucleotide sugar dehydrogenase n=1 Tax=Pedobacter sp. MC2016-14 TaxID=2897327 RepID=UPI001E5D916D|nr:nucleotide sugar dehydrogenase [Pedobacter sp. MC2016-14]MCD0487735.1 nucleotide sugar dehydrogenase [Pedobacter sp. MC2016-14]
MPASEQKKIAIIGLGYVGLPLAIEFAKKYDVLGFDTNELRVAELKECTDKTKEADLAALKQVLNGAQVGAKTGLRLSGDIETLKACNIYIVTVPTPIDGFKSPDLQPLLMATEMLAKVLTKGDLVIYESTVYPGCTEEDCVPVLEKYSGLTYNVDFYCGYSPERINPGDKVNTLTKIKKVTSGSTPLIAEEVNALYAEIITAGTYLAPSIKVAEASKAIENAQRDVNISFINELALIFDRMGIDTNDVLEAAATKWNFLKYKPGLVGGHCIGVDPYYLAYKSNALGYHPQVILSGRQVNENMGIFIANKVVKLILANGGKVKGERALILGFAFKENCPDIRNTRVIDIYRELEQFGLELDIYDPWANADEVAREYNIQLETQFEDKNYKAIIVAVAHQEFLTIDYKKFKAQGSVIFDIKSFIDRELVDARL